VPPGTRAEALEALKAELGANAFIAPANLSDSCLGRGFAQGGGRSGRSGIDILVNNAGITKDNLHAHEG
jgi:3-oxoacyl-[acyl-carrier protein] reductase